MTPLEIGEQLVELFRQGKNHEAIDTLYARDVVSIEAGAMPGVASEVCGRDAMLAVVRGWSDNYTVHSAHVHGPLPCDDRFILRFSYDVTCKASHQRFQTGWASLFTVKDGKICEEYFSAIG